MRNYSRRGLLGAAVTLPLQAKGIHPPYGGEGSADAELIALCLQFDELERAYQKIYDAPDAIDDEDEADRLARPIAAARSALLPRIIELQATTIEGLMTRARTVYLEAPEAGREAVGALQSSPYMNELLMAALHRDLMALAGVSVMPLRRAGA